MPSDRLQTHYRMHPRQSPNFGTNWAIGLGKTQVALSTPQRYGKISMIGVEVVAFGIVTIRLESPPATVSPIESPLSVVETPN